MQNLISTKKCWETPIIISLSMQKTETFCTDQGKTDGTGDAISGCGVAIS